MDSPIGSEINFKPCCGERRKSPYVITEEDVLPFGICSSEIPTSNAKPGEFKIENQGACPRCTSVCSTYAVYSRTGSVIRFTPCCGEIRTSPYVVTEQDEREGFAICSTTIPTSDDPDSKIGIKGDCLSCDVTCNTYDVFSYVGAEITFQPCCGEVRNSPYTITEGEDLPIRICSLITPTCDSESRIVDNGSCPDCAIKVAVEFK